MAVPFPKKLLTIAALLAALLLCGCGTPLLSQRSIVRAVFFDETDGAARALLLLGENAAGEMECAVGRGETPQQALYNAEQNAPGTVFYGLMELAALPAGWEQEKLLAYGRLLLQEAQPAPEVQVLLLGAEPPRPNDAEALYRALCAAQKKYGMQSSLAGLFARENECALPVWQGDGFGLVFLRQGGARTSYGPSLAAQLAAVLCGEADRFDCTLPGGNAALTARAALYRQAEPDGTALILTLKDAQLHALAGGETGQTLTDAAETALHSAFRQILQDTVQAGGDPLGLRVFDFSVLGAGKSAPRPRLEIFWQDAPVTQPPG